MMGEVDDEGDVGLGNDSSRFDLRSPHKHAMQHILFTRLNLQPPSMCRKQDHILQACLINLKQRSEKNNDRLSCFGSAPSHAIG